MVYNSLCPYYHLGMNSCGEPSLGSKFCNFNRVSSALAFLDEKFMVLLNDDFILWILGFVLKCSAIAKLLSPM